MANQLNSRKRPYHAVMDVKRSGRRLYTCLHCERGQRVHVSERYRMTIHVYRNHMALDQAPFFCSLCQFRCMTMGVLEKHAAQSKHLSDARARGGEPRRFLGQNHTPKLVSEGVDFRLATEAEAVRRSNPVHEGLSPEEEELDGAEPDQGLISISVTPQMLAELLNKRPEMQQPQYVPTVKSQVPPPVCSPVMPPFVPTALPNYLQQTATGGASLRLGTSESSPFVPVQPVSTVATANTSASVNVSPYVPSAYQYVPSFGDAFISAGLDSMPDLQTNAVIPTTSTSTTTTANVTMSQLNTPVIRRTPLDFTGTPEVEDLNDQLLGKDESESCFSPVNTKVDTGSQTKVSHTKSDLTPTASSMAITHLAETIKVGMEKMYQAIERNSRRVEEVNRSMGTIADTLTRMERSVDSAIMRQLVKGRRDERAESSKKPRLESKENHPPKVASVVKDPKQQRRSGK